MYSNSEEELAEPKNWPMENEVHLLFSTLGNKPVGIDKHIQMTIIWNRFASSSKKMINSDLLWKKLSSWYNLKYLDSQELLPFSNDEEEFLLPSEIIPEHYQKYLSEEEKKNVDFTGAFRKYLSVTETDEEDLELKSKLRGSEKMKWFECPQYYKSVDKPNNKKLDSKSKVDANESSNDSSSEPPKVLRQYGKGSGSFMTVSIPSSVMELDDNVDDENTKEEFNISRSSRSETDKLKLKRKRDSKKDSSDINDDSENSTSAKQTKSTKVVESTPTSNTRSRKASGASQETSSCTEMEKEGISDDTSKNSRRRFSQRFSENKSDFPKPRKSIGRR